MRKLLTSLVVDDTGVSSLKFVQKRGVLLCGHEGGLSYYSVRDDFQTKQVIDLQGETG